MALSPPTFAVWLLSTLLVALVVALKYFAISIPVLSPIISGHLFEVLLVSFGLLWAGTVFKGI
ncbi:MAG: hypothetical protein AB7U75_01640 [Hyphomicrobiaceae bacterium]